MVGQGFAPGPALRSQLVGLGGRARGLLQRGKLRLQAGLVGGQRLGEQLALLGAHALGLGAELPAPQLCELERDLLDLRVPPQDLLLRRTQPLVLRANMRGLLINMRSLLVETRQQLRNQRTQFFPTQTLEVCGLN